MIELRDVSKVYQTARGEVRAVDGLTATIDRGEFVAVRGPSGCGKSTLLSLIGGLDQPTSGEIVVDGQVVSKMTASARAAFRATHVGFVFQLFHLLPYVNVLENVLLAAPSPGTEATNRARELLDRFGLTPRLTHHPAELSAGERQRVAIARALLNRPGLLLADEPTGNLDPESGSFVLEAISDFHREGGTVLLVTHESQATGYASRALAMRAGALDDAATVA